MPQRKSAQQMASRIEASLSFFHRANIERYNRLLSTDLSDGERRLIQAQLANEEAALFTLIGK